MLNNVIYINAYMNVFFDFIIDLSIEHCFKPFFTVQISYRIDEISINTDKRNAIFLR